MSDIEALVTQYSAGRLSRRSFVRRLLALGVSATFAESLLGMPLRNAMAAPVPTVPSHAPYVVVVVMDAFRADYLELQSMPNLEQLMARGTMFTNAWVGQLESYTPASHATISTGAMPAHSGVIGFDWRDPKTGQETYTGWYDDVMAGRLEQQLTQHGVNSIPLAVKAQDPNARVVALSSEKYYAADAMGGAAADYIFFGMPQDKTIYAKAIPHHAPPEAFLSKPSMKRTWPLRFGQFDAMSMDMALESLTSLDPRVLMINLPGPDIYGHRYGGPIMADIMKRIIKGCDDQIGRLTKALRDRGILDQTVMVVTGDHGMVPNNYQIDVNVLKQRVRDGGGDYLFHSGGNSAYIWLRNPAAAHRVAAHLVKTLPHAPFAHVMSIKDGAYSYVPVVRQGLQYSPDTEAAYQYLLGTFAGPLAPDISLAFEENTITRVHPGFHGEHGGATWGAQQVPLVMAGPGVAAGKISDFPARLMDIAPTVLTLLGLPPTNMDGIPLVDVMLKPTVDQQKAHDLLAPKLTAFQQAIIAQSQSDLDARIPKGHVTAEQGES